MVLLVIAASALLSGCERRHWEEGVRSAPITGPQDILAKLIVGAVLAATEEEPAPPPDTQAMSKSNCVLAHGGDSTARVVLAWNYQKGEEPLTKDLPRAYLWFTLADKAGSPLAMSYRDSLMEEMTSAEVAEAERLVEQWKPDPESCGPEPNEPSDGS